MKDKKFVEWAELMQKLCAEKRTPFFREGDVWWMAVGENIGIEINGKNEMFSRPVLVFRKYGAEGFFGIPLSSQLHEGLWYESFEINGTKECALLSQANTYSVYRFYKKIGRIRKEDYERVAVKLAKLLFKKNIPPS